MALRLTGEGYHLIIVGDANHAEIKGVAGNLANPPIIIDTVEEVLDLRTTVDKQRLRRVGVIFQTTHSFELCSQIINELIQLCKEVQVINTICRPVRNRQMDAVDLAQKVDVMVVVGSRSSANTIELKHLCQKYNPRTIHVEGPDDLDLSKFEGVEEVGIASGLSTPPDIVEQVKRRLIVGDTEPAPELATA
jgi:4-hydroxy-3-methylbut-2-enyl diphosphate reductase